MAAATSARRSRRSIAIAICASFALLALASNFAIACFTPAASGTGMLVARLPLRKSSVNSGRAQSRVTAKATFSALQARPTLDLIKKTTDAGNNLRELGAKLEADEFEAIALDGSARVVVDGMQDLRKVELKDGALEAAGGNDALAKALLVAMQEAHDKSYEATRGNVWELYQGNTALMQAPLNQIGAGSTAEDLWANVERTEETLKMAEELFDKFDVDKDGYWNQNETSAVQMATEGTEMSEEAFNALLIAAAPNGGRNLSEDDLAKGLSKEEVISLYTDAPRQRQLGFVLDVKKDHAAVFKKEESGAEEPAAKPGPVAVD